MVCLLFRQRMKMVDGDDPNGFLFIRAEVSRRYGRSSRLTCFLFSLGRSPMDDGEGVKYRVLDSSLDQPTGSLKT